jgi:branched-chain amino acid aminotransferase
MIAEPRPDHIIWMDGSFRLWRDATMPISANHFGFGVFEGVRSYAVGRKTAIFRLEDHTARLFRSARIMKIATPELYDPEYLNAVQIELLKRNRLRDAYVRPFIYHAGIAGLSPDTRQLSVHVAVLALEWKSAEATARGISLKTSTFTRVHPNSLLLKAKANANYINGMLALREAQAGGADDALLLDQNGFATETSGANLFAVRNGTIYTPPLTSALEGVTRDTIIRLATDAGVSVAERLMSRDDLYAADEIFLTGTAAEVRPVGEFDGRRIGSGTAGPITDRLRTMYASLVRGQATGHEQWLTQVDE